MPSRLSSLMSSTRRIMAAIQRQHVHAIVRMHPRRYAHTRSCHHTVLRQYEPTFRTILTLQELHDFKRTLRRKHGSAVRVRHAWRRDSHHVSVAYSPEDFCGADLRKELEEELYYLLFDKCLRSHEPLLATGTQRS